MLDRIGQKPALIEADIAGRRADEPRDGVRLGVFAHVEAYKLDAERDGELFGEFGLADARGAREEKRADGLFGLTKPERESLIALTICATAWSCPKMTARRVFVEISQTVFL